MAQRFLFNTFIVRSSLIILLCLFFIQVQLVKAQEDQDVFQNLGNETKTTTVCQISIFILHINKTLNCIKGQLKKMFIFFSGT